MRGLLPWCRVVVASAAAACLSSACATSSTLPIPSCAERVVVDGADVGRVSSIVLDHTLDPPGSATRLVLQSEGGDDEVWLWNNRPDLSRLFFGGALVVGGSALGVVVFADTVARRADDVTPAVGAVLLGSAAAGLGTLVMLTGWHPSDQWDLEAWCHEEPAR